MVGLLSLSWHWGCDTLPGVDGGCCPPVDVAIGGGCCPLGSLDIRRLGTKRKFSG